MSDAGTDSATIDVKTFWQTLGQRAIGATVVTAADDDGPVGFLGLSAAHVTANPPTMLVSIDRKTSALATVLAKKHFAVNFLPAGAAAVAETFGGKAGLSGADRFAEGAWDTLATGAPVYKDALGAFDCVVDQVIERGSIAIVIGTVAAVRARGAGEPLIFFRGKFMNG